jgi:class 3 adenylate cyclase/tetratricopeptide (TPR) repeat protein
MPICAQCATENPEIAKFCLACGSPLAGVEQAEEERKPVTVVFVDVVGSTSTAESLDPEDVQRRLDPYYRRVRSELERFGGTVEKFIGDAVVALFGAPVARGDDAERAVRAALAVLDAIDALNDEDPELGLAVRVGVNTGEAYVALGARSLEGEGMAWGDVVNTAARLQSAAPPGGVIVGEETWRATRRTIEYRERPPVEAKGKARPVRIWQAVGTTPTPHAERPLVDRESELEALEALWQRVVAERHAAIALVTGPAGIGKTRLVTEVERRIGAVSARGRCLPYGEGMTYWPVIEVLKEAAGILQTDATEELARKMGAFLDGLPTSDAGELRTMAVAASNLLETRATPRGTYSADEISQAELHWGLRRLLELSAERGPLVVVLEDLHWAEPTLLELIRYVADGAAAPILLLCSARPGLTGLAPELRVDLEPLSAAASRELLLGLLGDAPAELLERADGNPLFLEELAGAYGEGSGAVPTTLQALIGARLDSLGRGAKRVAQHAAVCGTVFWPGAVAVLTESGDVDPELEELEQRELARRHAASTVAGEREWSFKHVLIRDVAYGRLPKALRARLHERFARWVASLGHAESFVEIRAWHLEQACRLARESPPVDDAVTALTIAAEKAERREGNREADRFYARALALLDAAHPRALELRFRRARLLALSANHAAAQQALEAVDAEAQIAGDDRIRAQALVALGNVLLKQGRPDPARNALGTGLELAEAIDDASLRVRARYERAQLRGWFEGDLGAAIAELQEALDEADPALRVEGTQRLGVCYVNAGRLEEAEASFSESIALASARGSVVDEGRGVHFRGVTRYYLEGPDAAEAELLRADEWLERVADSFLRIQNLRSLAKCRLSRNDPAGAESLLRTALPLALEAGGWLAVEIYRYLVEALLRLARVDDASTVLALARPAGPGDDQYARAALLIAEGLTAHAVAEAEARDVAFATAFELLAELELHADLAEARLLHARATGAPEAMAEAREAFARIDAKAFLAEIDRELASASA